MGDRMAARLCGAGFEVIVWNRSRTKADDFARARGARVADTPATLAGHVDAVVSMVTDQTAVRDVLLGPDGVGRGAGRGLVCVDCSTIGPTAARSVGRALAERGIAFVDAPVSGSLPRAESGTLTMMVGGSAGDVELARPLLEAMGEKIVHVGELGQGQMVKVISNTMAAANAVTVGEALLMAKRAGVDLEAFLRAVPSTSGGSAMLDQKAVPMWRHDYTTLFKLDQMAKDVRLCLEEAQSLGIPFTSAAQSVQMLVAAAGRGHGSDDYAALIEALEGLSGERL